jgi:hypothetical protein
MSVKQMFASQKGGEAPSLGRVGLALEPWPHHVIDFYGCRYVDALVGPLSMSIHGSTM